MERLLKYRFILLTVLALLIGFVVGHMLNVSVSRPNNVVDKELKADNNISESKNFSNPALIYFYSKDCSSCDKFKPNWKQIKKKFVNKYEFIEIDVDDPRMAPLCIEFMITIIPSVYIEDAPFRNRAYVNPVMYQFIPRFEDELNRYLEMREILKRGANAKISS